MVFKAYDIRGQVPGELDDNFMRQLGRAYGARFSPTTLAVGYDARLSSPALAAALVKGLTESGVLVAELGRCATEQVYFASQFCDGGLMVTASHNPAHWNGVKLIGPGATPVNREQLIQLQDALAQQLRAERSLGDRAPYTAHADYLTQLAHYLPPLPVSVKPLKIVANAGNGVMGELVDQFTAHYAQHHGGRLPIEWVKLQWTPDGRFPFGVPNPLLSESRETTTQAILETQADFGVAWDGDGDRCFFFDDTGQFIEGYYIVGLLAEIWLKHAPGSAIVHDPRLIWNTQAKVNAAGGIPVQSLTGHAFMKAKMREVNAIYGGEMSAHHYFRAFAFCDSGMIPWLMIAHHLLVTQCRLRELVEEALNQYPCSGERNFILNYPKRAIERVRDYFANQIMGIDETDGLSLDGGDWRCNLRCSNTESLLRLNVETRAQPALLNTRVEEIQQLILSES